jgi:hypothetical protein
MQNDRDKAFKKIKIVHEKPGNKMVMQNLKARDRSAKYVISSCSKKFKCSKKTRGQISFLNFCKMHVQPSRQ